MKKYDILTDFLARYYAGEYKSIKRQIKEDTDTITYRVNFGDSQCLAVNTIADCIYLNIAFKEANALEFLSDVTKQYEENKRKDRYERAKERLLKAQEELALLESEMKEECN